MAFLPEDMVLPHVEAGRLKKVMPEWCPRFPGLHAYYTSRRHPTRALATVIEALQQSAQTE
ncbi:LysR substrate-binding domain-containing protein [Ideonella azotifigens]|uniref:LysR substrate-binding domain-containing protein n=1 Tax=Ideonella azotifigens TaxID=513160 RepID=A0ABN1JH72_9BURK|nr:LysR substrate-binding domain-containing protein [Ideonella azotifigens]